jgi:starvation-inducible DNA-binding protein
MEHGDQLFGMTDEIAWRVRKIGGTTIRSIGQIRVVINDVLALYDDRTYSL